MSCERYRDALTDAAAGGPVAAALEAHLAGCAGCRSELAELRQLMAAADEPLSPLAAAEPSAALRARIREAVADRAVARRAAMEVRAGRPRRRSRCGGGGVRRLARRRPGVLRAGRPSRGMRRRRSPLPRPRLDRAPVARRRGSGRRPQHRPRRRTRWPPARAVRPSADPAPRAVASSAGLTARPSGSQRRARGARAGRRTGGAAALRRARPSRAASMSPTLAAAGRPRPTSPSRQPLEIRPLEIVPLDPAEELGDVTTGEEEEIASWPVALLVSPLTVRAAALGGPLSRRRQSLPRPSKADAGAGGPEAGLAHAASRTRPDRDAPRDAGRDQPLPGREEDRQPALHVYACRWRTTGATGCACGWAWTRRCPLDHLRPRN